MKVKELIEQLIENYNPEEELIVAYWDKSAFKDYDITDEELAELTQEDFDWSSTHDNFVDILKRIRQDNKADNH